MHFSSIFTPFFTAGKYRGSAHRRCNLLLRLTHRLPIFFHGLRHYDSHFILRAMALKHWIGGVDVIPKNMEQYISFTVTLPVEKVPNDFVNDGRAKAPLKLVFLDSYGFLGRSLSDLASSLNGDLPFLKAELNVDASIALSPVLTRCADKEIATRLLSRKGCLPYDHLTDVHVFDERSLPEKKDFYSLLYDREVNEDDYTHAKSVWDAFELQTFGEYVDLYLATDVVLLVDVMEKFRTMCHNIYGLDPSHYFSIAGLSWDACLKMTGVTLDPITDNEVYLFLERGKRGGFVQVSHRYAKANNPLAVLHSTCDYDASKPNQYLIYVDENNLYGLVMTLPLPTGGLEFIDGVFNLEQVLRTYTDDSAHGYFFEVDLDYPADLHDLHNDFPLAPELMVPPELSPISEALARLCGINRTVHNTTKLIAHLGRRERYVVHVAMLQLIVRYGLIVSKVHRVLRFNQSAWLRPYIEFNTRLRANATDAYEKDLFKLMNNA